MARASITPESTHGRGHAFTRYEDVTHVAVLSPGAARQALSLQLRARGIRRRSGGAAAARCSNESSNARAAARGSRISDLDARALRCCPRATFGLAAVCVVVFVFARFATFRSSTPAAWAAAGARRRSAPSSPRI
jgi:hypothetical protein